MNSIKRVALHRFNTFNFNGIAREAMISTVQLEPGLYETMVLFHDGDELECHRTRTLADAKAMHNSVMRRWNDRLYEGSVSKTLGIANVGQFVHPVVTC